MIEEPSAALMIVHIAGYVVFFSIGTNNLTQYIQAINRSNERVADLASPFHSAVIQLIAIRSRLHILKENGSVCAVRWREIL